MSATTKKHFGFTLVEVLIAVFIFTIISLMMVSGLRTVLQSSAGTEKRSAQITDLQMTLLLFSRDFEEVILRPITNAKGAIDAALIGNSTEISFTRAGFTNPLSQFKRSTLQRVRYSLQDETIERATWQVLDQTAKSKPDTRKLLNNIEKLSFEYLTKEGKFSATWPANGSTDDSLPLGIKVSISWEKWGKISQFYLIPAAGLASENQT